jgi:tetratricopeptide (TPR) repeat protein
MRTSLPDPLQQGMALFQQGQPAAAIPWFDQALALQPASAWALHFKGYALCQLGRFEEGTPLLERALEAQPRNAVFNANLGMIRYALGEVAESIRILKRAVEIDPTLPEPYSNLALGLRERGDFEPALAAARRAVHLRPEFGGARLNLSLCLLSLGRWEEAWEAYRWRPDPRVNLRDLNLAPTLPHGDRLPQPLAGAALTLHGDQGLGDALFFMRFAVPLREAGARLRFWGDARLGTLRTSSGSPIFPRSRERRALRPP